MKYCPKCDPTVEMELVTVHEERTASIYCYVCPECYTTDDEVEF